MSTFTLAVDLGGAAFVDDPTELPRILRDVSRNVADVSLDQLAGPFGLYDTNGNRCGAWEITDDDRGDAAEAITDLTGDVATITRAEYRRSRRHQHAGPVGELLLTSTRERSAVIGATHWQIIGDRGATVLRPVRLVDDPPTRPVAECPYCGTLSASGTYRDPGDPPRARYCRRCGRPVVGADLTRDPLHVLTARYLGHDAALAAASWVTISEGDAAIILDDIDPEVLDRYPGPRLSTDPGDETTAEQVAYWAAVDPTDEANREQVRECGDVWQAAADDVWGDALAAVALRTLGRVDEALWAERALERRADELRKAAQ